MAGQYSDILDSTESARLARTRALSCDARRLFARLLTRKGPLFRADSLRYAEVADTDAALVELGAAELVQLNPLLPGDLLLSRLTVPELRDGFPVVATRHRGLRKDALVDAIAAGYPERLLHDRLAGPYTWVLVDDPDWLLVMRVLFFGGLRQDFSTFVLDDLGVVQHESYPLDRDRRLFSQREELVRYFELRTARQRIRLLESVWQERAAQTLVEALWQEEPNRLLERERSRLLNTLGRTAERQRAYDLALGAYRRSGREPGRERRARVLARLDDGMGVTTALSEIESQPHSAGERHFAIQFGARRGQRSTRIRKKPREQPLRLAAAPEDSVERAALTAWLRNGGRGAHLENSFALALLGLAFWDVVFAPVPGVFTHPYQDAPLDLYWSDFRATRADAIADRLAELAVPGVLADQLLATYDAKYGVANALVHWARFSSSMLELTLRCVPVPHLLVMFDFMLDDLELSRTGFPDLVLWYGPGVYRLVEVKGPGDQLRREQRLWFDLFESAGIPATVLRVGW